MKLGPYELNKVHQANRDSKRTYLQNRQAIEGNCGPAIPFGLKPKDIVGMPWRVAFALQGFAVISGGRLNNAADMLGEARESGDWEMVEGVEGMLRAWADLSLWVEPWWNRCDVVWFKSNPMPESVRDRPTRAHEYVFLLTRSGDATFWAHRSLPGTRTRPKPDYRWQRFDGVEVDREPDEVGWRKLRVAGPTGEIPKWRRVNLWRGHDYFYDSEAVKEGCNSGPSDVRKMLEGRERIGGKHKALIDPLSKASSATNIGRKRGVGHPSGRNLRSVWAMATQPYPGAHYATFPPRLPEICIRAGTSEKGVCPECGAPWVRVVERNHCRRPDGPKGAVREEAGLRTSGGMGHGAGWRQQPAHESVTRGWRPTCGCGREDTVPAVVVDPFAGSGTTGIVAVKLGRDFIGLDLAGGDCDLGGHTPNQRIVAARAGLGLEEALAGQTALFGRGG